MNASPSSSDISIDLDSSVLHQVKKAIHRFAAVTQQESDVDNEVPLPSLDPTETKELSLEDKKCEYEYQIRSLEAEIQLLEDELRRREQPVSETTDDQLEQAMLSLAQSEQVEGQQSSSAPESPSTSDDDGEQLKALRSQIRLSESFSGVKFKTVSWEITQKDDDGLFRKHIHSGSSHGFTFQVHFIVREEKIACDAEEATVHGARIIGLRAKVDPAIRTEMQVYLKRASTDCDLMTFYQTFVKCCRHVRERRTTFNSLKVKYGDQLDLSEGVNGTRMRFVFSNGCCLNFNWNVIVTDHGRVDHSISLQTKATSVTEEQREALSQLPHLLENIISTNGHSQGLTKFLSLLVNPTSATSSHVTN